MSIYKLSKEQIEFLKERGYSMEKKGLWSKLDEINEVELYIDQRRGCLMTYGYTRDGNNKKHRGDPNLLVQLKALTENQSKLDKFGIVPAKATS